MPLFYACCATGPIAWRVRRGIPRGERLQRHGYRDHHEEQRIFPAAAGRAEHPAITRVDPEGAAENWQQQERDPPGRHIRQQQHSAHDFGCDHEIRTERRKTERGEVTCRSRETEREYLQHQAVREVHDTQRDAQQCCCGVAALVHQSRHDRSPEIFA
jgi:hypothetical protein